MTPAANSLAEKLQLVLDGAIPLQDLFNDPTVFEGSLVNCAYGLEHFLADADIREKDPAYREMQHAEMRKLIWLLRSGADGSTLRRISFLGSSDV